MSLTGRSVPPLILSREGNSLSLWEQIYNNLIAQDRWMLILRGLGTTLLIAFGAIVIGTVIGIIICLFRMSNIKILRWIGTLYITVIRGVPVMTQLMIFAFVIFAPYGMPLIVVAIIGFGVNSGAYVSEIFRAGIQGVDIGQMEAGRSLGLKKWQTMVKIIFPQAFKNILPTYTNEFIVLIKETSVAGYIAIQDLTKVGDMIRNATFNAWVPLITTAVIYLILTLGLAKIFSLLERRLARSDRG